MDFEVTLTSWRIQHIDSLVALALEVARLPTRPSWIPADPIPLVSLGELLAVRIRECSTDNAYLNAKTTRTPHWWFEPLRPMVFLDSRSPEVTFSRTGLEPVLSDEYGTLNYRHVESPVNHDLWISLRADDAHARSNAKQGRLHISRFHAERVTMVALARALAMERLGPSGTIEQLSAWDELQDSLNRGLSFLGKEDAFGRNQRSMVEALRADLQMNGAEWDVLHTVIQKMRPQVAQKVESIMNLYIQGGFSVGDHIHDVTGSQIVNRSTVVGSFNSLRERGEVDLEQAMTAIAEEVQRSGSDEAAEAFEALAEEVSKAPKDRRKTVVKGMWDKVIEFAPSVASLATAAAAVAKLFAG